MESRSHTVQELAAAWGFSPATVRRLIAGQPGVLRLAGPGDGAKCRELTDSVLTPFLMPVESGPVRQYVSCRIPSNVAERIRKDLLQPSLPVDGPRTIKALRRRNI